MRLLGYSISRVFSDTKRSTGHTLLLGSRYNETHGKINLNKKFHDNERDRYMYVQYTHVVDTEYEAFSVKSPTFF